MHDELIYTGYGFLRFLIKCHFGSCIALIATARKFLGTIYPENLDISVEKSFLRELSLVQWSDKSLVYKTTNDDFIIYGVGSNFIYKGGMFTRDEQGKII